jgi:hypothetical protein
MVESWEIMMAISTMVSMDEAPTIWTRDLLITMRTLVHQAGTIWAAQMVRVKGDHLAVEEDLLKVMWAIAISTKTRTLERLLFLHSNPTTVIP